MREYEIGEIIPVTIKNKMRWSIIVDTFNENRAIIEHIDLRIYKVLYDTNIILIDESCIYNGWRAI